MKKTFITLLFLLSVFSMRAQNTASVQPALIPYPAGIEMKQGEFILSKSTQLILNDKGRFTNEVYFLQTMLKPALGQFLSSEKGNNSIEFTYNPSISGQESYTLDVSPEKIRIEAGSPAGAFYALQTLRQLLPVEIESGDLLTSPLSVPALHITDRPAFEWRGSHIDVSRHFYSLEYLKRHIDRLALYKMNKMHIHLSDDQGWRIEIKQYPELTNYGAWRNYNDQDSACIKDSKENPDFAINPDFIIKKPGQKDLYGGYYTQEQMRELIRYAQDRHVELIPEIDMPGHMMAAIANYPYLTDGREAAWGKEFSIPLCPCKDSTYIFVNNVLTEIMDLFPSKYMHIGADEVEKTSWKESPLCRELMQKEGIKSVNELQSYFVHRVQTFVESKGKKVICWDEALDGGISPNVDIMYWRGWVADAPERAVKNGNRVIMTPTNPMYFDYLPNASSLSSVYNMDVIYKEIPKDKQHLIIGAQANLWAEKIPSENRADFLLYPRLTALAERVWTNRDLFDSYMNRLLAHYSRLDALHVNYRLPDMSGFAQESVFVKEAFFNVKSPLDNMKIHYTTDGSIPSESSPRLDSPLKINKPTTIKFALFSPGGVRGEIYTVNYRQSPMLKATTVKKKLTPGLQCNFYKGFFKGTKFIKETPDKELLASNLKAPDEARAATFALKFNGYINVPESGVYSFYFTCDDGGVLYIDGQTIVDNDGLHSPTEKSGQAALAKGLHPIQLDFVEGGGGFTLKMQYSLNGSKVADIPDSWFVH